MTVWMAFCKVTARVAALPMRRFGAGCSFLEVLACDRLSRNEAGR